MSSRHQERRSFLDLYLNGEALAEDIDDYIDEWHAKPGDQEIYDFLGLSRDEYSLWLRDPDVLPHIARARLEHRPLAKIIASLLEETSMAARASDAAKITRLKDWLAKHGKID